MAAMAQFEKDNLKRQRNRRDHYVQQGYLRGFIHPSRLEHSQSLWHFDIAQGIWSERSTREMGFRIGMYDLTSVNGVLETADDTFKGFENTFPRVRREMIANNFENWFDHLDFLLQYIQMMRARSILFFEQKFVDGQHLRLYEIERVNPDGVSVTLRSMEPSRPSPDIIRNWTITEMRTEIQKGAAWLGDLDWALRICESPDNSFLTSENPLLIYGTGSNISEYVKHADSLFFFPLCWQACLIGSRRPFDVKKEKFGHEDIARFRRMYKQSSKLFLASPVKFDI
jgi:uncharacterized protein DUF4238